MQSHHGEDIGKQTQQLAGVLECYLHNDESNGDILDSIIIVNDLVNFSLLSSNLRLQFYNGKLATRQLWVKTLVYIPSTACALVSRSEVLSLAAAACILMPFVTIQVLNV